MECSALEMINGAFTGYVFWLSWGLKCLSEETQELCFFTLLRLCILRVTPEVLALFLCHCYQKHAFASTPGENGE